MTPERWKRIEELYRATCWAVFDRTQQDSDIVLIDRPKK